MWHPHPHLCYGTLELPLSLTLTVTLNLCSLINCVWYCLNFTHYLFIFSDRSSTSTDKPETPTVVLSMTTVQLKRVVIRCLIVAVSFLCGSYFLWRDETVDTFVGVSDIVDRQYMEVPCSEDYAKERELFSGETFCCLLWIFRWRRRQRNLGECVWVNRFIYIKVYSVFLNIGKILMYSSKC